MLKGKRELVRRHLVLHRRQAVEIGLEVDQVLKAHALVRGVGKRRIEILAVGCHAALHRVDEVERAPIADACLLVGRDIRHVEGADRASSGSGRPPAAPCLGLAIVALFQRRGVALGAAARGEHVFAVGEVGVWAGSADAGSVAARHGQQVEDDRARDGKGKQRQQRLCARRPALLLGDADRADPFLLLGTIGFVAFLADFGHVVERGL